MDMDTCIAELRALAADPDRLGASEVRTMLSDVADIYRTTVVKDETADSIDMLRDAFVRFEKAWDDASPDVRDAMLWMAGVAGENRAGMLEEADRSVDTLASLIAQMKPYRSADAASDAARVPPGVDFLVSQLLPFWRRHADPQLAEPKKALHALEIVARFVDDSIDYGLLIEALNARLVAEGRDPVR
jgi:hypothetical protein